MKLNVNQSYIYQFGVKSTKLIALLPATIHPAPIIHVPVGQPIKSFFM